MATLKVKDKAIVTSGYYERYFIKDGRRYHHLLDPRTGMPADTGLSSISLIGGSATLLDAITTVIFVAGLETCLPLLERYQLEGIMVNTENNVFITKKLQDNFEFIKEMENDAYETTTSEI
jgi:thiamine biosynthesis lipoprotein